MRSTASRNRALCPRDGSEGVEGTFAIRVAPLASERRTASVKVPPMSTPRRNLLFESDVPVKTRVGNQLYMFAAILAHNLTRELQFSSC